MIKTRVGLILFLCLYFQITVGQSVSLNGTVYGTADVEGIHVINKTSRKATTTNATGTFEILAKENDTLVFSGIQYKLLSIFVDKDMMEKKLVNVFLLENINQLDEVVVGKVLSGDLISDIENSDAKPPINFYDVGIPGFKGKKKTQSERRLAEAGEFKPTLGTMVGLVGGSIPINPILNAITGRTKMLKQRVKLEAKDELMFSIKANFSEDLFGENPLEESRHYDFFYFCSEDPKFEEKCANANGLMIMSFLQGKLFEYKENIKN